MVVETVFSLWNLRSCEILEKKVNCGEKYTRAAVFNIYTVINHQRISPHSSGMFLPILYKPGRLQRTKSWYFWLLVFSSITYLPLGPWLSYWGVSILCWKFVKILQRQEHRLYQQCVMENFFSKGRLFILFFVETMLDISYTFIQYLTQLPKVVCGSLILLSLLSTGVSLRVKK